MQMASHCKFLELIDCSSLNLCSKTFTACVFCRPQAKTPPQDTLLKLEKEHTFKELSEESSLFVSKLGLAKKQCCLLFNGLVHDPTEVCIALFMITALKY